MGRYTKILQDKATKKLMTDKKVHEKVYKRSLQKFDLHKRQLISAFKDHNVTKEIEAGPTAMNISGTIVGSGNLFSFIGFYDSDRPISPVLDLLMRGVKLLKGKPKVTRTKTRVYLGYQIKIPTEVEFSSISGMPWESGSWLYRIERGMSGLGYYIYERGIRASRSGTGIQADGKVRPSMYKRTSYLSAILSTFKKKVSKGSK